MAHRERIAVLGDLSGHLTPVLGVLARLGVRFDDDRLPRRILAWPDDLTVIQVGDLVHKGPVSELVVGVVHDLLLPTGRWVQLLGNHEAQYVPGGWRFWQPPVDQRIAAAIAELWASGTIRAAAAVHDELLGDVLVTHAGLSPYLWRQLGRPATAAEAAAALNARDDDRATYLHVLAPGRMAGVAGEPGVAWAEARTELHLPWHEAARQQPLPFSQIHGHSAPLLFAPRQRLRIPDALADVTVREKGRHVVTSLPGGQLVGIDPGANGRRAAAPRPRMLSGELAT